MVGYEVVCPGLAEQIEKLGNFDAITGREFKTAMSSSVVMIQSLAREKAPMGVSGELRGSITGQVVSAVGTEVTGKVGSNVKYAAAVEFGARPHFPPLRPVALWVQRKLGLGGWEGISVTIRIARAIQARGTRAQPFLEPAFEEAKGKIEGYFQAAVERILEQMVIIGRK